MQHNVEDEMEKIIIDQNWSFKVKTYMPNNYFKNKSKPNMCVRLYMCTDVCVSGRVSVCKYDNLLSPLTLPIRLIINE